MIEDSLWSIRAMFGCPYMVSCETILYFDSCSFKTHKNYPNVLNL